MQFIRKTGGVQSGTLLFGEDIRQPAGLEPETLAYLSIPGVSLTGAQVAALDANIKLIKYGAGITLAAVTLNLSLVAGTTFISNPSVDMRPYKAFNASLSDGAKTLTLTPLGAVGTGQTYSAELNTAWTNGAAPYDTLTTAGDAISSAIKLAAAVAYAKTPAFADPNGKLYRFIGNNYTLNSGVAPRFYQQAGNREPFGIGNVPNGTAYQVGLAGDGFYYLQVAAASNFVLTISGMQVLTPSATGIYGTIGTEQATFNRNKVTGYDITITKP